MINHYERCVAATEPSLRQAFALNNVSLAITDFGAAQQNKRKAEFCIAMQDLGVTHTADAPATAWNTTAPAK